MQINVHSVNQSLAWMLYALRVRAICKQKQITYGADDILAGTEIVIGQHALGIRGICCYIG